jgi:molecular chaperone GrpE
MGLMMAEKTGHQDAKHAARPHKASLEKEAQDKAEAADDNETSGFADPLEFLRAELERVEADKAEAQDKLIRLAAEMENLRKRTAKDVVEAREYSIAGFAREMLAVSDNLRRALEAVPEETREAADPGVAALIEGVELTERAMLQGLEKHDVKRISPAGERFDPNFHQAMFEVQDVQVPANTVSQVVQDGYVIGDRVLRPALVGVSKGGPKAAPKADEAVTGAETGKGESGEA